MRIFTAQRAQEPPCLIAGVRLAECGGKVAAREVPDRPVSLLNLPATREQRTTVLAIAAILLVGFAMTAPFASVQLPAYVSFNPSVGAVVFVNDLVTSVLLFSQY